MFRVVLKPRRICHSRTASNGPSIRMEYFQFGKRMAGNPKFSQLSQGLFRGEGLLSKGSLLTTPESKMISTYFYKVGNWTRVKKIFPAYRRHLGFKDINPMH